MNLFVFSNRSLTLWHLFEAIDASNGENWLSVVQSIYVYILCMLILLYNAIGIVIHFKDIDGLGLFYIRSENCLKLLGL